MIMSRLVEIETGYKINNYLTFGRVDTDYKGKHHIENMDEFKKMGLF